MVTLVGVDDGQKQQQLQQTDVPQSDHSFSFTDPVTVFPPSSASDLGVASVSIMVKEVVEKTTEANFSFEQNPAALNLVDAVTAAFSPKPGAPRQGGSGSGHEVDILSTLQAQGINVESWEESANPNRCDGAPSEASDAAAPYKDGGDNGGPRSRRNELSPVRTNGRPGTPPGAAYRGPHMEQGLPCHREHAGHGGGDLFAPCNGFPREMNRSNLPCRRQNAAYSMKELFAVPVEQDCLPCPDDGLRETALDDGSGPPTSGQQGGDLTSSSSSQNLVVHESLPAPSSSLASASMAADYTSPPHGSAASHGGQASPGFRHVALRREELFEVDRTLKAAALPTYMEYMPAEQSVPAPALSPRAARSKQRSLFAGLEERLAALEALDDDCPRLQPREVDPQVDAVERERQVLEEKLAAYARQFEFERREARRALVKMQHRADFLENESDEAHKRMVRLMEQLQIEREAHVQREQELHLLHQAAQARLEADLATTQEEMQALVGQLEGTLAQMSVEQQAQEVLRKACAAKDRQAARTEAEHARVAQELEDEVALLRNHVRVLEDELAAREEEQMAGRPFPAELPPGAAAVTQGERSAALLPSIREDDSDESEEADMGRASQALQTVQALMERNRALELAAEQARTTAERAESQLVAVRAQLKEAGQGEREAPTGDHTVGGTRPEGGAGGASNASESKELGAAALVLLQAGGQEGVPLGGGGGEAATPAAEEGGTAGAAAGAGFLLRPEAVAGGVPGEEEHFAPLIGAEAGIPWEKLAAREVIEKNLVSERARREAAERALHVEAVERERAEAALAQERAGREAAEAALSWEKACRGAAAPGAEESPGYAARGPPLDAPLESSAVAAAGDRLEVALVLEKAARERVEATLARERGAREVAERGLREMAVVSERSAADMASERRGREEAAAAALASLKGAADRAENMLILEKAGRQRAENALVLERAARARAENAVKRERVARERAELALAAEKGAARKAQIVPSMVVATAEEGVQKSSTALTHRDLEREGGARGLVEGSPVERRSAGGAVSRVLAETDVTDVADVAIAESSGGSEYHGAAAAVEQIVYSAAENALPSSAGERNCNGPGNLPIMANGLKA